MCEYLKLDANGESYCSYTNNWCTLCIFGNSKTYNEAKDKELRGDKG